jgi:hypothetical protein
MKHEVSSKIPKKRTFGFFSLTILVKKIEKSSLYVLSQNILNGETLLEVQRSAQRQSLGGNMRNDPANHRHSVGIFDTVRLIESLYGNIQQHPSSVLQIFE